MGLQMMRSSEPGGTRWFRRPARLSSRQRFGDAWTWASMLVIAVVVGCVLVSLVSLEDATIRQDLLLRNLPPFTDGHPLGTDNLGRDMLGMLVVGARSSLLVAVAAAGFACLLGATVGAIAGLVGGRVDAVIMRWVDLQMSFPTLLLALTVLFALGPGLDKIVVVIALTRWVIFARVCRSVVLAIRGEAYMDVAKLMGTRTLGILRRHVLPNLLSPIIVLFTLEVARAMLFESSLSFLGLGVQPPDTSWGLMLATGRAYVRTAWWLAVFPGLAIVLTCLSLNILATRLRTVLDPVLR